MTTRPLLRRRVGVIGWHRTESRTRRRWPRCGVRARMYEPSAVRFYFDESGDFAFPSDGFDCYTMAGVVCPESFESDLGEFVQGRHERWSVAELHAAKLTAGQRLNICRFIAQSPLQLVAYATDTVMVDRAAIARWRVGQAKANVRNLAKYRAQGGQSKEIEEWMEVRGKRVSLASRISDAELFQAILLLGLTHAALQKSLIFYLGKAWNADFTEFRFIYDGKLPNKLGAGEKYLRDTTVPSLGSDRKYSLDLVDVWKNQDPPHPFIARFERHGGWAAGEHVTDDVLDLKLIFEHGLQFEDSRSHPGLQIADVVANVARRAVLNPDEWQTRASFDLLRDKMRYVDGRALQLIKLDTGGSEGSRELYRALHWA
jgi:Protein of unknown function (DUF3800)